MASLATHPVQVLREHGTALEAALSVCLVDPGHRPVHRLRTETRRVEAQLLLLAQLPEMPDHHRQAERLHKALKRLRRAAGKIRDLDVQQKSLEALGNAADGMTKAPAKPKSAGRHSAGKHVAAEKAASIEPAGQTVEPEGNELHKTTVDLSAHLRDRREKAVHKLQTLLHKRQGKAAQSVEALMEVLTPVAGSSVSADTLLQHAQAVFTRSGLLDDGQDAIDELDEEDLHTLRKAAKAARYLAETLPGDAAVVQRAKHYESLQQVGGEWHDALDLGRAARRFFGRKHMLSVKLVEQRDEALARYRELLKAETGPGRRKPERAAETLKRQAKTASVTEGKRKRSTTTSRETTQGRIVSRRTRSAA